MADKYFRLVCFVVNVCAQPLRELFLKYVKADPIHASTSLDGYLASRKSELETLKKRKLIREDQWELLFPASGQVDYLSWDITLIILLIGKLFRMQLQQNEEDAIGDIRQIRNQLQHMATTSIDDSNFDGMWNDLETATIDIAKQIKPSPFYENKIKRVINETKVNNMPDLGDTLRNWYQHIIIEMKSDMEELKVQVKNISNTAAEGTECLGECRTILRESSVQKVGPSGNLVKRMKTVDPILTNMNLCFETTMKETVQTSLLSSPAVSEIKTKLRDVHHVVVTGHRGIRYFEIARAAIFDMGYNHHRCVQMRNPSDWEHIDLEEVDLLLCREPFGDCSFDNKRAKSMAAFFSEMHCAANPPDGRKPLDIVIVTEKEVLRKALNDNKHDLLREVVQVYQPTTESEPVDLTKFNMGPEGATRTSARNILELTALLADRYKDVAVVSKTIEEEAKAKLKKHKVILITGPKQSGKTTLALKLASVYGQHQFINLIKPEYVQFIRLDSICIVLIEDFAGKHQFDSTYSWEKEFDMLYSAVYARKLNVILTSETTILEKHRSKFGLHQLLQNTVELKQEDVHIKEEKPDENTTSDIIYDTEDQTFAEDSTENTDMSTYVFLHLNTTCLPKHGGCRVTEICMLAVNKESFEKTDDSTLYSTWIPPLPRVTSKLVLCLNPDTDIHAAATSISELTNESLSRQGQFNSHTVSALQEFLKNLEEPACFIAHNGNAFDFAVMKAELELIGQPAVFDHMFCADSLHAVRELDLVIEEIKSSSLSKRKKSGNSAETSLKRIKTVPPTSSQQTPGKTPTVFKSLSFPMEIERQNKSYALRAYYEDKFEMMPSNTHTAEGYCEALVTVVQTTPNFATWVNNNKKKMSEIIPAY